MANIEIQVNAVEPFAEGRTFGEAGPYLRIRAVAKGELDPAAPANRVIVDLDKAPRNARGLVEYETDFFILRPVDPGRTNGVLVYDVTNRGSKRIFQLLDDAPSAPVDAANDPKTAREAGLGFASAAATASSGRAGTLGRPPPTTVSARVFRPRWRTAGRSPAGSATSFTSAPARPARATSCASPTRPSRPTRARHG